MNESIRIVSCNHFGTDMPNNLKNEGEMTVQPITFWAVVISGDHFFSPTWSLFLFSQFPSTKKKKKKIPITLRQQCLCKLEQYQLSRFLSLSFLSLSHGAVPSHTSFVFFRFAVFFFLQTTHKSPNSLSILCFKSICTVCPAGVARETLLL